VCTDAKYFLIVRNLDQWDTINDNEQWLTKKLIHALENETYVYYEHGARTASRKLLKQVIPDGKKVVVVDDSIVRGTTSRKIVQMIRKAGAKEVHMRISAPPTKYPCFYGIDTPNRRELIASTHTIKEVNTYITSDSVGYISVKGLLKAVGKTDTYCKACFDGDYPVSFPICDKKAQSFPRTGGRLLSGRR